MEKNKIHIYLYNALIVFCLLGGAVYVVSQFMHFGSGEFTDNARVRQNIVPQSSRVQGFIREVRFADFQQVKKGDTLAIIEDAEFRLRLAQAETNLLRAEQGSQGTASRYRYHQNKHDRYRGRHRIRTCADGECHA